MEDINTYKERCIYCGLCLRLCARQKVNAMPEPVDGKKIKSFWEREPENCIGCLVCAKKCPKDAIPSTSDENGREIWGRSFEMHSCRICGCKLAITALQAAHYTEYSGLKANYFDVCDACSRAETMDLFLNVMQDPSFVVREKMATPKPERRKMPTAREKI